MELPWLPSVLSLWAVNSKLLCFHDFTLSVISSHYFILFTAIYCQAPQNVSCGRSKANYCIVLCCIEPMEWIVHERIVSLLMGNLIFSNLAAVKHVVGDRLILSFSNAVPELDARHAVQLTLSSSFLLRLLWPLRTQSWTQLSVRLMESYTAAWVGYELQVNTQQYRRNQTVTTGWTPANSTLHYIRVS